MISGPRSTLIRFSLSRPIEAPPRFKYITLPSDPPPMAVPAKGTQLIYAHGVLTLSKGNLKLSLESAGNAAPPLAVENFSTLSAGLFEGSLPMSLIIGSDKFDTNLQITGNLKRRDFSNEDSNGNQVEVSLKGRAL